MEIVLNRTVWNERNCRVLGGIENSLRISSTLCLTEKLWSTNQVPIGIDDQLVLAKSHSCVRFPTFFIPYTWDFPFDI